MYESDKRFSVRGVIVTILLIILIICVLLWLFPIKKSKDITYSEKFNTNIKILENAGRAYYYRASLPTKVNTSKKVDLKTLIKEKKVTTLKDKDGKSCDNSSYVELTKKNDKEFDLKAHLKCADEESETVSKFYCSETKSNCVVTTKTVTKNNKTTKTNTTSNTENKKTNTTNNNVTYRYLYSCKDSYRIYSDWSNWTTDFSRSDTLREVQTKTVTNKEYVKIGTKQEPVTTYTKKKVTETTLEEQKWVNKKPGNAKSCYSIPKSNYTIYVCQVEVTKEVEKEVPVTTYKTVDVYGYKDVVTTYYRTRTFKDHENNYTYWDTNPNKANSSCKIIRTEVK